MSESQTYEERAFIAENKLSKANAELERLSAENARLRKDAQRYQWIRIQKHVDIAACWLVAAEVTAPATSEELDAAIDAAIKAGEKS